MREQIKIGITMGDPGGIGAEIIAKIIVMPGINRLGKISVIGDSWVFSKTQSQRSIVKKVEFIDLKNVRRKNFKFGRVRPEHGLAAVEYLKEAVELIKQGKVDCLVTAPISKEAINLAGYKYSGHTEFLAGAFGKNKEDIVMMLLNKYLKISLVTQHLPLQKIISGLNREAIYKTIIITHRALKEYFTLAYPRICVAALNPHAGEGGLLGDEEIEKILPAIKRAKQLIGSVSSPAIFGPLPADSAFSAAKQGRFEAVVAMYHDQALIPLKVLDYESGVNLTLGLGFVRTSPLHGTGFDIAGRNLASCKSLIAAIKTAVECTENSRRSPCESTRYNKCITGLRNH